MTTPTASSLSHTPTRPRLTLLPDPPQPPDMATQLPDIARAHMILADWYSGRADVLVSGEGYLCYDASDLRHAPRPDCLVTFATPLPPAEIVAANGYTISEIGKPPDFVLEVASASTGVRDYTVKRELYANYGVAEYWRFDRTGGQYHDTALAGDRLLPSGVYQAIPVTALGNGVIRGYSPALGLELRWVERKLRFWDPVTQEYLPDLSESKAQTAAERAARQAAEAQRDDAVTQRDDAVAQRDDAVAQRDDAVAQRDDAVAQRDAEAAARQAAEERVRQLEARLSLES